MVFRYPAVRGATPPVIATVWAGRSLSGVFPGGGRGYCLRYGTPDQEDDHEMSSSASPSTATTPPDAAARERIIPLLERAYWMEIETVMNYLAASINPDGVRARQIADALRKEVADELEHARRFGERIKELYGVVPGSLAFTAEQSYLQPPERQTDVSQIVQGVIEAERGAIEHYHRIIAETDGVDWVTNDMAIEIVGDEQKHLRLFEGFQREVKEG
jgi:bacterioferritin